MGLSLSLDIGWDCQWVPPRGKWFKTKAHSASAICWEYQLCLLQNVHGGCWPVSPMPARGHRCNLSSFPCHSSDQSCWYPSLGAARKKLCCSYLTWCPWAASSSSGVWPSLKWIFHWCAFSISISLLSLPLFCLKNPNRLTLLPTSFSTSHS